MKTRVRFAPSPTGRLHIGNIRTAILNWLFAKNTGGKFILRIEDTDLERSAAEYTDQIYEDLRWLGLLWDEGPDIGGTHKFYRQSERLDIYKKYAQKLLNEGNAYYCFCSPEELEQMRKESLAKGETIKYNQKCRLLNENQKKEYLAQGRKPAIRFKAPAQQIIYNDLVKGELLFESEYLGDFVIMRGEQIPTYNFAAVVDDGLMEITHIIRGDDHVSNTPKQILVYHALGFALPKFAHIPMILGPDRTGLSKRHGATSLDYYRSRGYLPEVIINFLSLLSWSSVSGEEILSIQQLIDEFDFKRISKAAAVFDIEKLNWMNGFYIRQAELDRLTHLAIPYLKQANYPVGDFESTKRIVSLLQNYLDYMDQVIEQAAIFYQDGVYINDPEARMIVRKDSSRRIFWSFLRELNTIEELDANLFRKIMKTVQKETGVMGRDLWIPIRVALTGKLHGPELPHIAEILGIQKCEKFIKSVISS
ncbi:MAG: glutamate--tRNA ligase [bacterium]|nr:MAG: glutamate--tRNA ligase [bacterium]